MDTDHFRGAMTSMELRILRRRKKVVFELPLGKGSFSRFRVLNARSETVWDLVPSSVASVPIAAAESAFFEIPEEFAEETLRALRDAARHLKSHGASDAKAKSAAVRALDSLSESQQEPGELPEQGPAAAAQILDQLRQLAAEAPKAAREEATQDSGGQPIIQIEYGQVPAGYRQVEKARALVRGEMYCVLVFGSEAFEMARDSFIA